MVKNKLIGAAGRFGSRYGQHVKRRIAKIEEKQRKKQHCPFCNKTAKRLSKGIWKCKKCKKKFAAHAYFLEKDAIKVKSEREKIIEEKPAKPAEAKKTKETKPLKEEKSKPKSKAKAKTKPKAKKK